MIFLRGTDKEIETEPALDASAAIGDPEVAVVDAAVGQLCPDEFLKINPGTVAVDGLIGGHGGVGVFDETVDMSSQARFAMEFCAAESCGKCTPCRIGSTRGVEVIDKIRAGQQAEENLILLKDLCDTMEVASLCAMGGMTPFPVRSAVEHFSEDFESKTQS